MHNMASDEVELRSTATALTTDLDYYKNAGLRINLNEAIRFSPLWRW